MARTRRTRRKAIGVDDVSNNIKDLEEFRKQCDSGGSKRKAIGVEDVFNNIKGRCYGLMKALTTDLDEFRKQCDSDVCVPDKECLLLYGFPCGRWAVETPESLVQTFGVIFSRDGMMQEKDWLEHIARSCDMRRLYDMVVTLPKIVEQVNGTAAEKGDEEKDKVKHLCSICGENDLLLLELEKCCMTKPGLADCFKCPCCSSSSS